MYLSIHSMYESGAFINRIFRIPLKMGGDLHESIEETIPHVNNF